MFWVLQFPESLDSCGEAALVGLLEEMISEYCHWVMCSVRVRVAHPGTHPVEAIFKHLPESIETIEELFRILIEHLEPLLKLAAVFGFKGV